MPDALHLLGYFLLTHIMLIAAIPIVLILFLVVMFVVTLFYGKGGTFLLTVFSREFWREAWHDEKGTGARARKPHKN